MNKRPQFKAIADQNTSPHNEGHGPGVTEEEEEEEFRGRQEHWLNPTRVALDDDDGGVEPLP